MNTQKLKNIINYHLSALIKISLRRVNYDFFSKSHITPIIAALHLTGRCNFRCCMCGVWHSCPDHELTTQEWKNTLEQVKDEGVLYVYLSGGEPLLRDDLVEIVNYAHSLGLLVSIATNGSLLTEELAKRLVDAGVSVFVISLDALGEEFDRIRGVSGAYEKVNFACEILSKISRNSDIGVVMSTTLMKPTLKHIINVVEFAQGLNISVYFSLLDYAPFFFSSARNSSLWIGQAEQELLDDVVGKLIRIKSKKGWLIKQGYTGLHYMSRYFKDPVQKNIPCAKSLTRILIDYQGRVFGGCWSLGHFGEIRRTNLRDIIHSEEYLRIQKKMFLKECPGCACGYTTDLNYSLRHLLEETKFRILAKFKK